MDPRGSLVQSGCPEAWAKVWSRPWPHQLGRYYRGTTTWPAAGAVIETGNSPAARVLTSLPAADVDAKPVARQPARSVRSGCGGRNANAGTSEGRAADGSTSAAVVCATQPPGRSLMWLPMRVRSWRLAVLGDLRPRSRARLQPPGSSLVARRAGTDFSQPPRMKGFVRRVSVGVLTQRQTFPLICTALQED
ncbi:hypothetical protein NDU88_004894 [Pleurodeles waltl]|uniref:Uncharacterized protein n=1 Tax=Pleurodeles waltl TaxID=8319 RepID=A0AAV7NQM4_PLEWA|nr:hypothetical protein NDU88_004894 [Pleurodeles waltl]